MLLAGDARDELELDPPLSSTGADADRKPCRPVPFPAGRKGAFWLVTLPFGRGGCSCRVLVVDAM